MNEILQKRIEEAAKKYCQDKNYILPDDTELSLEALTAIDAYIEAAKSILQNQWISVEEALPEDKTKVFVIVKTPVGIVHRADYHINDYWYMSRYSPEEIVTHWMPIPSLGGGEE